jgi:hypothetical protein
VERCLPFNKEIQNSNGGLMMKQIFSILLAIIILGMISTTAMARQITFFDSGELAVISKEVDSPFNNRMDTFDLYFGNEILTTAGCSIDNDDAYSLGMYLVASRNCMIGYYFAVNEDDLTESTVDFRARTQVNDNLTLSSKLDWATYGNDNSIFLRKTSLTAQAEYFVDDDFLLLSVGGLVADKHNDNSKDTYDTYLVAGIEVALLANVAIFVDEQIPLDNKNEGNKTTFGIAFYRFKP